MTTNPLATILRAKKILAVLDANPGKFPNQELVRPHYELLVANEQAFIDFMESMEHELKQPHHK